jgi:hypothetical protein
VGIGIAAVFAAKYNFDSHRFGRYVVAAALGVCLLTSGTLRIHYSSSVGLSVASNGFVSTREKLEQLANPMLMPTAISCVDLVGFAQSL